MKSARRVGPQRQGGPVHRTKRRVFASIAVVTILCITAAWLSGPGAAAANNDGVTARGVTIGYIWPSTGVASSVDGHSDAGCRARIARENAKGGVNGRKINVEYADDQSSVASVTVAQDLVRNKHVFMVVDNSPFAFVSYGFLLKANVPMIGPGYDGTYYGAPGNEKILSPSGNMVNIQGVSYDLLAKAMKQMGASKLAALAYSISQSDVAAVQNLQKLVGPRVGLKPVYTNTTVDFGTTDVDPLVRGIKNAGADAVYLPLDANTALAVVQGLAQNGAKMKSEVLGSGYGQDLLDQKSVAKTFGPNIVMEAPFAPVELKTKATKQFQADLEKYAGITGVPDYSLYFGYITCDMAVLGLKHAGNPPQQANFSDSLRKLGTYDQAGLACAPVDISAASYGKAPPSDCGWFVRVKDGKFVTLPPKGKSANTPWKGTLIQTSTQA